MSDRTSHEVETLTIRIPMRLQRRGGRKLIMTPEGVADAYVCRLLPLTCLAPNLVEAILDGRQPKGLRLAEMLGNGPLAWEEQWSVRSSCGPAKATGASRGERQSNL